MELALSILALAVALYALRRRPAPAPKPDPVPDASLASRIATLETAERARAQREAETRRNAP